MMRIGRENEETPTFVNNKLWGRGGGGNSSFIFRAINFKFSREGYYVFVSSSYFVPQ